MIGFAALVAAGIAAGARQLSDMHSIEAFVSLEDGDQKLVSVVVPARDEAETLPRLLTSVAHLSRPPHEVVVVDDGSRDGTAEVAARYGATVVAAADPPPGWLGKPWACHVGASATSGTHLVFLDADTWLAPDALGRLLAAYTRNSGLMSVQPWHATKRWHEELSAYCNLVGMMGSGAFAPHTNHTAAAAFGPCLLTTRRDYEVVGGHAAVRGEVVDDLALAQRYRAAGLPVYCYIGEGTVQFRMYAAGVRQLVDGWTKNLASGAAMADRTAVALTALWISAQLAVTTRLAVDVSRSIIHARPLPRLTVAATLVTALQLRWMLRRIGAFRRLTALLFPIPLATFVAMFVRSIVATWVRQRVVWRSREIRFARGRS
jgi:hypothetical protein